jgi:penicillin V acylase-like amidase (Ntn superfamily)
MLLRLLLWLLMSVAALPSIACTTFLINKNGQLVFGRNYDWVSDAGIVCTNLRGLSKSSLTQGNAKTISWISKYGSITFNQYGKEFPTGGMNEKGLVVELMWLDETQYPAADNRAALNVLQWVQYQLDNHATVSEIIASDKLIRIDNDGPPLHYLVADASGKSATIEFLNGKMVVHQGSELPFSVLTNSTYESSVRYAGSANAGSGNNDLAFADNSIQRFTKACSMLKQYESTSTAKPAVDQAFEILDAVSQGEFTVWSIVYDISKKQIHFKTGRAKQVKTVRFDAFDFSCGVASVAFDMNKSTNGDVSKKMIPLDETLNRSIINKAASDSKHRVNITPKEIAENVRYASAVHCKTR